MFNGRKKRGRWRLATLSGILLCAVLTSCGSSSSPKPTATAMPQSTHVASGNRSSDGRAVAVARRFLVAFRTGDRATMKRLMSPRLKRRNRHQFIGQMLGVQNVPQRITILRSRTFKSAHGAWTRVVAGLRIDHGVVTDRLSVVKRHGRYLVDNIRYVATR